jgi:hypothetical protein
MVRPILQGQYITNTALASLYVKNVIERRWKMKMDRKEWAILFLMLLGFFLMGLAAGGNGAFSFAGLGLIIWVFWRGRKILK